MHAVGLVTACYTNITTGREVEVLRQKNLILFEGADIMAGLLGGRTEMVPSHFYLQYENTNLAPVGPTFTRADGRQAFEAIAGNDPAQDWLRVPIISTPLIQRIPDNSEDYAGNAVIFSASSASSQTLQGESPAHNYFAASGPNGPSKVVAVALAAAVKPSNHKLDKIFSRLTLTTALPMQANHHLTFYWSIRFN